MNVMFVENGYYGHRRILQDHAGVPTTWFIPGRLQHGWSAVFEYGIRERYGGPFPKYVWSERMLREARALDVSNVIVVGAPIIYLPERYGPAEPKHPRSLVAFPYHGSEWNPLDEATSSYERYAETLNDLAGDGFGPITVCLYWKEYDEPGLRKVFTRRGFDVTTNGRREDAAFLPRLCELVLNHSCATSNMIATIAFYVLWLNRPFFLAGPSMEAVNASYPVGDRLVKWQGEHFADLSYSQFDGSVRRHHAQLELGVHHKMSPEQMREVFLWNGRLNREVVRTRKRIWAVSRRVLGRLVRRRD